MGIKVGINGFGRIGRVALRLLLDSALKDQLEVVAINDLTDSKTLAHLLKYDSVHGTSNLEVTASDHAIVVEGHEIKILAEKDPSKLPWKDLAVELVIESTGLFTHKDKASLHIKAGAKKVIISAPSPDPDITLAYGVNHKDYNPSSHQIISCASCTTNCLAPVARILQDTWGILRGSMTTIHSYTNDQRILDLPHKDLRRARAAAVSMIPTTTGAAKAIGLVIPELKGKLDGFAVRVPTPNVSMVDLVAELERDATVEELNDAFRAGANGSLKGILAVCDEPLVSIDFRGARVSSTIDSGCTMVIQKRLAKVISWYDNEVGFSSRMLDVCGMVAASLK